jgi:hypothetical protein
LNADHPQQIGHLAPGPNVGPDSEPVPGRAL